MNVRGRICEPLFRKEFQKNYEELPKTAQHIRIQNRCKLTGRRAGVVACPYPWYLSRMMWREAADAGKVSGYTRANW